MKNYHPGNPFEGDALLVFGPQAVSFSNSALNDLRSKIRNAAEEDWASETIAGLPELWAKFLAAFPKYNMVNEAQKWLQDMLHWLQTGDAQFIAAGTHDGLSTSATQARPRMPNIVLGPLVVLTHLIEYMSFIDRKSQSGRPLSIQGVLGFCTGQLSARAASISKDRLDIRKHGAAAIRLAMLIGGMVDAQERLDSYGPANGLATAWTTADAGESMQRVLQSFPEAYISVVSDEKRATVTTSVRTAEKLQEQLRAAGVVVNDIGLHGRFHSTWYSTDIEALLKYCNADPALSLPEGASLPHNNSKDSRDANQTSLAQSVPVQPLRSILVEKSEWYNTFTTELAEASKQKPNLRIVSFGPEKCIPASLTRTLGRQLVHAADLVKETAQTALGEAAVPSRPEPRVEDEVAVIGMSIKVAGADDVDEFWDLLCHGESQHKEVPKDRLSFDNVWRKEDTSRKWYGNFVNDHDAFDHKFFKKTAREMASTDPQQRHMLQVAYQAVEQSGYFGNAVGGPNKIGCFVGVCSADYENNMACYEPNAFTAVGNLKSFIAGKISHYFGWQGPSLCIDSACSSSLVAVHQACRSVLSGECSAALAGGANIMTNSLWFQNLAGASFLSPTGQCKPFDANGDGYCRGEGFAAVLVKKMSQAIADGDQILGTISSTGVLQNQNCTPVFVPNSPSLADLFRDVTAQANLEPKQISFVEAHGTGTQVGDPAEYAGILEVLGGPGVPRSKPLGLGSVKGLVGHTECTSGAVSLVKTILMLQNNIIPPQKSHDTMNPAIKTSPTDNIEVVTQLTPWIPEDSRGLHAALINNYGASGSNASMIVTEAPRNKSLDLLTPSQANNNRDVEYPVRIFGSDEQAIARYCQRLQGFLEPHKTGKSKASLTPANLAFNLARQSNPTLPMSLVLSFSSIDQLAVTLGGIGQVPQTKTSRGATFVSAPQTAGRPVILCFGGQISTFVGLDRGVYESSAVFRSHLHACDKVCQSLPGVGSIFPCIFQQTAIQDTVELQTALFSMQYACARTWMDSGITPAAVVGHSFGELVALCIAGTLSLRDALFMIAGRASLIRDFWGEEKGAMMAVEGDLATVQKLLARSEGKASIACFNGPTSFTLAGTVKEIDNVARALAEPAFAGLRSKRLSVTNAFHSHLVDRLTPQLEDLGREITFNEPHIPIERATERPLTSSKPDGNIVSQHMRNAVYFHHALQRLAQRHPAAIFLEAGSASTVTAMASRALGSPKSSHFQSVNITGDGGKGLQALTNATLSLWKEGLRTTFWPHHRAQTYDYKPILLPPYQFAKSRHWMDMKAPPKGELAASTSLPAAPNPPAGLFTLLGYQDTERSRPSFRINTETEEYLGLVSGHMIAKTAAICPATLIVSMAIEALTSVRPELSPKHSDRLPEIHDVVNQAAICVNENRTVVLEFEPMDAGRLVWTWKVSSSKTASTGGSGGGSTLHATGVLKFASDKDVKLQAEFKRFDRLTGHRHCIDVLDGPDPDDVIHGHRNIYRAFSDVVDYAEQYRGLQRLVGKGSESAGRVVKEHASRAWLDTHVADCISQVGGIWVNCMTDCSPEDMYIAVGFEKWMRNPLATANKADYPSIETWDVLARHERVSDKTFLTDIFVFDAANGVLLEVILGINYHKVSKSSMKKTLARLAPGASAAAEQPTPAAVQISAPKEAGPFVITPSTTAIKTTVAPKDGPKKPEIDVAGIIRLILADISGLEPAEITDDAALADIGIDSLMGMELGREMEGAFKTPLMGDELASVLTFNELVACVSGVLGVAPADNSTEGIADDTKDFQGSSSSSSSGADADSELTVPTPLKGETYESEAERQTALKSSLSQIAGGELRLAPNDVFAAFEDTKRLTDNFIAEYRCAEYMNTVLPRQTQLCVALAVEALQQLGCDLVSAAPGDSFQRISHPPEHQRLTDWMYKMLQDEGNLIEVDASYGLVTRTAAPVPDKSSSVQLTELLEAFPDHEWANRLMFFTGSRLADVLRGQEDGIKLIFGTDEGRELVAGLYGDSLLNKLANAQMRDVITKLVARIPKPLDGPLKIMELGAGTGGTTRDMVPLLAKLGVPIEYTFTDLSGSFVAAARKKFGKEFPFMKFRVHDIEKAPAAELLGTQHIVIASNAIHATRNIRESVSNVRKALRPDGFLMMLEMTQPVHWVDIIFGLFEGWWLFEDGRRHAIAHQTRWRDELQAAGYGRVDWTDGWRPEIEIQRVMVAQASVQPGFSLEPSPMTFKAPSQHQSPVTATGSDAALLDEYVSKYSQDFSMPSQSSVHLPNSGLQTQEICVAVTGATGSLGAHLVAHLVSLAEVKTVVCLNRRSTTAGPKKRQEDAFSSRGIQISPSDRQKIQTFEIEGAKPQLGLDPEAYRNLAHSVTHIVHNAWPMTGKRPVTALEPQFKVMRNLVNLARDAALHDPSRGRVTFELISSIAVMGHHPLIPGNTRFAPEDRAVFEQLLPNGYAQAKWVCERLLDGTLHQHPAWFRAAAVRPGQIAGSSVSGYWNEQEHLAFLLKSSQTLRALPELEGDMCWTPVDHVAGAMADILLHAGELYPVYHIDNPVRQPWSGTLQVLAEELGVPEGGIIPFVDWVRRVRNFPGSAEGNPAVRLIDFLDDNFVRMSCGGMLLETTKVCEHSETMRKVGPVTRETVKRYLEFWKLKGFLSRQ